MNVLLLGANGQLGWELSRTCPADIVLKTCDFPKVDFLSTESLTDCIIDNHPNCIINAAAYTAVDKAEQEKTIAYQINQAAVGQMADLCKKNNIQLIHISTDYVFSGNSHTPYCPDDTPDPRSVYGHSKLEGEQAIKKRLGDQALIIRTAWLYSSHGANFVKTMLKLMNEKDQLTVVDDQIGSPTWANGLAVSIWQALSRQIKGTYHWTDAGVASWYDFAAAIQAESLSLGLLKQAIPILPVPSSAYPTPAKRPMYSLLDKTSFWQALGHTPIHWRDQLRQMLKELDS
jgi:dTDP-4-dehydrorhamnose reductase